MEYLYYLEQLPFSVSPLSNNLLFLKYIKNPFPIFFKTGLNVTVSTDDPLIMHMTEEPLMEEYSIAAKVWNLSTVDLSEMAYNSVRMSNFENYLKKRWLGPNWN